MKDTERPDYHVVKSDKTIELRDYPPMIFAETEVWGSRKEAIKEGFKILADYIFGNNTSSKKIAMIAPVIQEKGLSDWKVKFVMPKKYNLETLPKPNSTKIRLALSHGKRFAVIRFSGVASDENIQRHTQKLRDYLSEKKWVTIGDVVFAFYNPPWTLPFLRRNEIMIEVGTPE